MTVAVVALTLSPLSPAQAATKRYKVTATVDNKVTDVHHANRATGKTTVSGRVTGGPVAGKSVVIRYTNSNATPTKYRSVTVSLSSSGRYRKTFTPPLGGRWKYTVTKRKSGSYQAGSARTSVDAFQFVHLNEFPFYRGGEANAPAKSWRSLIRLYPSRAKDHETRTKSGGNQSEQVLFTARGGSSVRFTFNPAYRCKKLYFRVGVSKTSDVNRGTIEITQSGKRIVKRTMSLQPEGQSGSGAYEPTKAQKNSLKPSGTLAFTVAKNEIPPPADPTNGEEPTADPAAIKFAIGTPRAFCTYPAKNTAQNDG